jgi:hypothetical protein
MDRASDLLERIIARCGSSLPLPPPSPSPHTLVRCVPHHTCSTCGSSLCWWVVCGTQPCPTSPMSSHPASPSPTERTSPACSTCSRRARRWVGPAPSCVFDRVALHWPAPLSRAVGYMRLAAHTTRSDSGSRVWSGWLGSSHDGLAWFCGSGGRTMPSRARLAGDERFPTQTLPPPLLSCRGLSTSY